jgi:Na+/melibiose symporter-like transporter
MKEVMDKKENGLKRYCRGIFVKKRTFRIHEDVSKVRRLTKYGYGTGHILNDMCASLWFTYLLLFYMNVIKLGAINAGIILLAGQIADGIATVVVGIVSDRKTNFGFCVRYGKRKLWHLVGTFGVLLCYPFLFATPIGMIRNEAECNENVECMDNRWMTIYFSVFSVIHNISWAFIQISHLAMVPEITSRENERGSLITIRNVGSVASNIFVYSILWIMLGAAGDGDNVNAIGPKDLHTFTNVMLISVVGVGGICSLVFHVLIKPTTEKVSRRMDNADVENSTTPDNKNDVNKADCLKDSHSYTTESFDHSSGTKMGIFKWFLEPQFYLIACVYMVTRLFVNISNSYIPLYLQHSLGLENIFVAVVPLVMYISGLIVSIVLKFLTKRYGFKLAFALSCLIGVSGCLWIWFGCKPSTVRYEIFIVAALMGGGGSSMLISSLTIVSSLVGQNTESSAFVYGAMSFVDKLSCGLAFMLIQNYVPTKLHPCVTNCDFFQNVLVYVCGGASAVGLVFITILYPMKIGQRRDKAGSVKENQENKIRTGCDNFAFGLNDTNGGLSGRIEDTGEKREMSNGG